MWVSVSARVGSIGDNKLGGWWSYRASKAGLNQAVKTLDLWLERRAGERGMAVVVHPGTVRTRLSREFWEEVERKGKLMEEEEAAGKILDTVMGLGVEARGRFWDYKGEEIEW